MTVHKRHIVGLYGMVGTGKSTLSRFCAENGWYTIDQDILGHEVLQEYPQDLAHLFGNEIMEGGVVQRSKLGSLIFNNIDAQKRLMDFSHPLIIQKTLSLLEETSSHAIIEGAFFYQVKEHIPYTHLLYVEVEESLLIQRLLKRGHDREWIQSVFQSQLDIPTQAHLAHHIFTNNGTTDQFRYQIQQWFSLLS